MEVSSGKGRLPMMGRAWTFSEISSVAALGTDSFGVRFRLPAPRTKFNSFECETKRPRPSSMSLAFLREAELGLACS